MAEFLGGSERENDSSDVALAPGAVALIDALGFRGIWAKQDPALVVRQLKATRQRASSEATWASIFQRNKLHAASFSDTLIVGGTIGHRSTLKDVVGRVASAVAAIQVSQVNAELPLNYRGCIAVGKLIAEKDLFVGEAVDRAATWHEQAQAAVVWLTPAARHELGEEDLGLSFFEWPVPLKGSGPLKALVVNPFAEGVYTNIDTLDVLAIDRLIERFMVPFNASREVDVVQKAQNTADFLDAARAYTIENFEQAKDDYYEAQSEMHLAYARGEL